MVVFPQRKTQMAITVTPTSSQTKPSLPSILVVSYDLGTVLAVLCHRFWCLLLPISLSCPAHSNDSPFNLRIQLNCAGILTAMILQTEHWTPEESTKKMEWSWASNQTRRHPEDVGLCFYLPMQIMGITKTGPRCRPECSYKLSHLPSGIHGSPWPMLVTAGPG